MMFQAGLLWRKRLVKVPSWQSLPRSQAAGRIRSLPKSISSRTWRAYSIALSSEQSPPDTHRQRHLKNLHREIRTLDPAKLTPGDYIDFSSMSQPTLDVIPRPSSIAGTAEIERVRIFTFQTDKRPPIFPPGTHGFMYFHVPPHAPPLAGELRFRTTSSRDPASFAAGADLLTESGRPWRYPLYKLMLRLDSTRALAALLLQDGLVSQRTLDLAAASAQSLRPGLKEPVDATRNPNLIAMLPTLSTFGQEFTYHFAAYTNCTFVFIGTESIIRQRMPALAQYHVQVNGKLVGCCPFEGPVICSFERSTLPQHAGKRVVVIRVKRCVDVKPSTTPDGRPYPEELIPREGGLLNILYHHKIRPWAADVDKKGVANRALRVFFENEELYGSSSQ